MAYNIATKDAILDFIPKIIVSQYIDEIITTIESQFVGVFSHKESLDKILVINSKKLTSA